MLAAYPGSGAASLRVAGGTAFFFGAMSPFSQAVGIGMRGPVSKEDFDRLEEFFVAREVPIGISLCPHADPSVLDRLAERRYRVTQFEHTLCRALMTDDVPIAPPVDLVRSAKPGEKDSWVRTVIAGSDMEGYEELFGVMFDSVDATAYLTLQDGQPAGSGAVSIRPGDFAVFYSDTTLPGFRGRGLQSAVIAARLYQALTAGCTLAIANTSPGTVSQRNYERAGFRVAYTKAVLTSP
jgi:GNAT superfamily N-acetyltransferase